MSDAITREEKLMKAIATGSPSNIKPITREEMFLAKAGGQDVETPEPITRREKLLQGIIDNGGGGGSNPEGTITITENGTHDVTEYASAEVNIVYDGDEEYDKVKSQLDSMIDGSFSGKIESNVKTIRSYAFNGFTKLTDVTIPLAEKVGQMSFYGCGSIISINLPSVTYVNDYAFRNATALQNVSLPSVTDVNEGTFVSCSALVSVYLPQLLKVGKNMFSGCSALEYLDFPSAERILVTAFQGCIKLNTLVLRSDTVVALSNVSAFNNTPFAVGGTGGTVVCPQALIEQYKIETNWSILYEAGTVTFVAEEGSEYE